jgi:hypothetical protein
LDLVKGIKYFLNIFFKTFSPLVLGSIFKHKVIFHIKGAWLYKQWFFEFLLLLMTKTQSAKFEIEKFNGKNNFEIWKVKMHDLLVQQGVVKTLLGKSKKPVTISDEEWEEIDARALSAIRLCLADDVLFNIV